MKHLLRGALKKAVQNGRFVKVKASFALSVSEGGIPILCVPTAKKIPGAAASYGEDDLRKAYKASNRGDRMSART